MSIVIRLVISLFVSILFAGIYSSFQSTGELGFVFNASATATFVLASVITAVVMLLPGTSPENAPSISAKPAPKAASKPKPVTKTAEKSEKKPQAAPTQSTTAAEGERETGQVKWFNFSKGFGFITRDQGDDVFVHYRSIRGPGRRSLHEGQRVEFSVVDSDKGLQAEDVLPLDGE